jgi:SHS2 domain-containing protein
MQPFEFIDHTADYAMRARGENFRALVENAARGFIRLLADPEGLVPTEFAELSVTGDSREQVLIHALKEILLLEEDGRLAVEVRVLEATAHTAVLRIGTVPLATAVDRLEAAVKAVTYHHLEVVEADGGLSVQIVFDS